jgi:tetratricopeptide (TPR) repeat protein
MNKVITTYDYLQTELKKIWGPQFSLSKEKVEQTLTIAQLIATGKLTIKEMIPVNATHRAMLYAMAYNWYAHNRYEDAYRLFSTLCIYDPKNTAYLEGLAATCQQLKKYHEAVAFYGTLVAIDPNNSTYLLHLAKIFCQMGHLDAALKCCEAILTLDSAASNADSNRKKAEFLQQQLQKKLQQPHTKETYAN